MRRFLEELRRRRVIRVAVAYVVIGWGLIEVAATLLPMFEGPGWVAPTFTVLVFLGFPLVVSLAWFLQVTPAGLVRDTGKDDLPADRPAMPKKGKIRFVTAPDGVRIAYDITGAGPPLVKTAHWLTHLELDWDSPIWRHWLLCICEGRTMLRYDQRGCGLSDRSDVEFSLETMTADLETVIDAAGFERFPLFASSQGGPPAIAYAVRHPERVSALILYGSFARGWEFSDLPDLIQRERAMIDLVRVGWGQENPAFRQMFASLFVPDASPEQFESFNAMAAASTPPATAARILEFLGRMDVRDLLPQVSVPTLVIHARHDARITFRAGRELASGIPGAEFLTLDGRNHIILEHEPAFGQFRAAINEFLEKHPI